MRDLRSSAALNFTQPGAKTEILEEFNDRSDYRLTWRTTIGVFADTRAGEQRWGDATWRA
jgi:hypothetical protein